MAKKKLGLMEEYKQKIDTMKHPPKSAGEKTSSLFGFMFQKAIVGFFKTLWAWKISLFWVALLGFGYVYGVRMENTWVAVLIALVFASVHIGAYKQRELLKGSFGVADYAAYKKRLARFDQKEEALEFLLQTGLVKDEDADMKSWLEYDTETENYILHWSDRLRGKNTASIVQTFRTHEDYFTAVRSKAEKTSAGIDMTFYVNDPLDKDQFRDAPGELDPETMSVECAVDSMGNTMRLKFGDSSGMVVGGIPGSGKTAGVTAFATSLALSKYVNLSIIDGKGGEDWTAYAPAADAYIRGDEDLEPIAEYVEKKHDEMLRRLENQKKLLGHSNFWKVSADKRLNAGLKFELLIVDECQGLFEKTGRDKEEQAFQGRIQKALSSMVKRGRSAGFFVIFMTQKPTAESLPTGIRDNCGLRIAFRLTTPEAEKAVLGSNGDGLGSTALGIPDGRRGGAVLAKDTGEIDDVRFFYIEEDIQEALLEKVGKGKKLLSKIDYVEEPESEDADGGFEFEEIA